MSNYSLLILQVLFAACILYTRSDPPAGTPCANDGNKPHCVCEHPNGTIDLTPLSSSDGPKFNNSDLKDSNNFRYYYNPCKTFSHNDGCQNVYACQENEDLSAQYPLADENTEKMYYDIDNDPGEVILYYNSPTSDGGLRETRVQLVCNKELGTGKETITTTGDTETTLTYKFTLTSCHACPGGCKGEGRGYIAGPIGLSIIFLAIFGLLGYFIIGAIIMQVHYKKTGLDIIPNKGFWFLLPYLIKDGFMFTISPCMRIKSSKYEQL